MARKSIADLKSSDKLIAEAVEDFSAVSEIKYELAKEVYDAQDDETKAVIDRILATLQTYATGHINVGAGISVKIDGEHLMHNLLWLAVEVVKDLALLGIRAENFEFPKGLCAVCGSEITPAKRAGRRAGQ